MLLLPLTRRWIRIDVMRTTIVSTVPLLLALGGGCDDVITRGGPGRDLAAIDRPSVLTEAGTPPGSDKGIKKPDGGVTLHDAAPPAPIGPVGNPNGCTAGVPAEGKLVTTTSPTTVVGTGSAASCTFSQLQAAVAKGGIITFNCGGPATIVVTSTLTLPMTKDTVIDGGGNVTLDGGGAVQILSWPGTDFQVNEHRLTLQRIAIVNGKKTPTVAIPTAPAPCSQGWNDGEGGAIYMRDGNLTIIDSLFSNNQAAPRGPDTGGGGLYIVGSKHGLIVAGSTFKNNKASNGGGLGSLFAALSVYNSLFTNNVATGDGANSDDPSKCSVINNGQHEVGSGGNGGALYNDGCHTHVTLCGNKITTNQAGSGAFGGGLFFTSNCMDGNLTITDTTMSGNTGGHWTVANSGGNAGTAVGTNCNTLKITNSSLQ
jgi:hypothetical protein